MIIESSEGEGTNPKDSGDDQAAEEVVEEEETESKAA